MQTGIFSPRSAISRQCAAPTLWRCQCIASVVLPVCMMRYMPTLRMPRFGSRVITIGKVMYAPPSSGQHLMSGSLSRFDLVAPPDDFLRRRVAAAHPRRKLPDLEQPRQHRQLGDESLGHFHLEQLGDARADLVERLDAERHRHAPHRAEEVDRDGKRRPRAVHQHRMLEQQRLAAARLLHHAVGDLAQLEIHRHRLRDAHELAGLLELRDEIGESV